MTFKTLMIMVGCSLLSLSGWADEASSSDTPPINLGENLHYKAAYQVSLSDGNTPLWLNANKYGMSSLSEFNMHTRRSLIRPLSTDSARHWGVGYGLDFALARNFSSTLLVQQAFVEARWLHGVLTVGAKEYPVELKNQRLSSGSQTLGINARPIPQVRLALPDYWTIPALGSWFHVKGHVAFGMMTDDNWQHSFTNRQQRYADHVLYHSKAGYLKIGNDYLEAPLSVELGLEMAAQFGGTLYEKGSNGMQATKAGHGLKDFLHAFIPSGQDASDGEYANVEGNHLGSWVFRINYDAPYWRFSLYGDHFFEDHSQMFLLDYNGYGEGAEYQTRKTNRYFLYKLKDIMLGAELELKQTEWLRHVVVEYLYTKYQSGPYNHDRTSGIADHVAGRDDYYNHSHYTGWQHWGQVVGNPLYRSPLYNTDGTIEVKNNRFIAYHLGLDGNISDRLAYRVLATYQKGWGTYISPFTKKQESASLMAEATYQFARHWSVTGAFGLDAGSKQMYGHNTGFQLTVTRQTVFNIKKKRK